MASRPEDEAVVISNGEEIYVWRPKDKHDLNRVFGSNSITDQIKSFLRPVSSKMNFFDIKLQGYLPEQEDDLWLNPQGAGMYIERGEIGRLRAKIPAKIRTENDIIDTSVEFKYQLTRPEAVDTVLCSRKRSKRKASLVENNVTLDLSQEMFEEKIRAKNNPLNL